MNSAILKTEALCWLRFAKQMDFVASEAGKWNADVLAANERYSIEVEVKVSIADLRAEFRNKMTKHAYYDKGTPNWSPTYFYFAVPSNIADKALAIINELAPKAGLIVYYEPVYRSRPGERYVCRKKADKLHDKPPSKTFLREIYRRMGSELCGLHVALDKLKGAEIGQLEVLKKDIVDAVVASHGAADWEFAPDAPAKEDAEDAVR